MAPRSSVDCGPANCGRCWREWGFSRHHPGCCWRYERNFQTSSLDLAAALRSGSRNDVRGPGRRRRCGAGCVSALGPAGACDPRQRGVTRWDQARLIQINARRGWSAEAAIAPLAAVRDFPKLQSLRFFSPCGYCRGDFFAHTRRPAPLARRAAFSQLLCPAVSCAVLAGRRAGPDPPLAPPPQICARKPNRLHRRSTIRRRHKEHARAAFL